MSRHHESTTTNDDADAGFLVTTSSELAHTLKDGWRVTTTKVHVQRLITTLEGFEVDMELERMQGLTDRAHQRLFDHGHAEADRRNSSDTVTLEAVAS